VADQQIQVLLDALQRQEAKQGMNAIPMSDPENTDNSRQQQDPNFSLFFYLTMNLNYARLIYP
jgi:hypothetical protein